jgi:cytolysin-activating lysine-acyltransferase
MALWKKSDEKQRPSEGGRASSLKGNPASSTANGAQGTAKEAAPLNDDQLRQMAGAAKAMTATFGEIVSLLMRTPPYKHCTLADLEWLVAPALLSGQFSVATAQSKVNGLTSPVGLLLWASVSKEVDDRLSASPGHPPRVIPSEWKSGDILWVVVAAGDGRVVQSILKQLHEKQWAKKVVKMYAQGKDGKPGVVRLEAKAA